jgi:hypothetical protein
MIRGIISWIHTDFQCDACATFCALWAAQTMSSVPQMIRLPLPRTFKSSVETFPVNVFIVILVSGATLWVVIPYGFPHGKVIA